VSAEALPGVSRTAVWVAGMRASEGERADRLFDDRFARAFVSAAGSGVAPDAAAMPPGASEFLTIRTRFFDDQARAASAAGIRQVVLLAAGLDCRAFRLDLPDDLQLFELDLPEMFAFKEPVLASVGAVARCVRVVVTVDLRAQWADALTATGFDPGAPTAWLAEGLLPYLEDAHRDRLLAMATELSAPGSQMAFDYIDETAVDRPAMQATSDAVRRMGAQLMPTADSPADSLATHGWRARFLRVPALGEQYGRPLPAGVDMVASNATVLVTASR
jgi:methyltransferase (TIGR00027 family)